MKKLIANICLFLGLALLAALPVGAWLSTPLEVFGVNGKCIYQLEPTKLGFGDGRQVPCGTYGKLAVDRVSEIFM